MTLLDARLSGIIAGCREREAGRYEVDGVSLRRAVETVDDPPCSDEEFAAFIAILSFAKVGPAMARAMARPAPLGATA